MRLSVISAICVTLIIAGCSKSTKPPSGPQFTLIVADLGNREQVLLVNPDDGSLIDSIPLTRGLFQMVAHPEQNELIVNVEQGLFAYDLRTREQVGHRSEIGEVSLLEPGARLLHGGYDSLRTLSLPSLESVEADSAYVWNARAVPGGTLVAGWAPTPSAPGWSGSLGLFDLRTKWRDTLTIPDGHIVAQAFPHPDGDRALVVTYRGRGTYLFSVHAESRDVTFVTEVLFSTVSFNVVYSQAGNTAFMTASQDPDNPEIIGCARGEVIAIDLSVGTGPSVQLRDTLDTHVADLALSPDGAQLYCSVLFDRCFGQEYAGGVLVMDAATLISIRTIGGFKFPYQIELGAPVGR